jgi:hypothetical protein
MRGDSDKEAFGRGASWEKVDITPLKHILERKASPRHEAYSLGDRCMTSNVLDDGGSEQN